MSSDNSFEDVFNSSEDVAQVIDEAYDEDSVDNDLADDPRTILDKGYESAVKPDFYVVQADLESLSDERGVVQPQARERAGKVVEVIGDYLEKLETREGIEYREDGLGYLVKLDEPDHLKGLQREEYIQIRKLE